MALEKEEIQMSKATAPIYPLLKNVEHKNNLKADLIYRLNRTNDILNELKQEKKLFIKNIKYFIKPYIQLNLHVIHHQLYLQLALQVV